MWALFLLLWRPSWLPYYMASLTLQFCFIKASRRYSLLWRHPITFPIFCWLEQVTRPAHTKEEEITQGVTSRWGRPKILCQKDTCLHSNKLLGSWFFWGKRPYLLELEPLLGGGQHFYWTMFCSPGPALCRVWQKPLCTENHLPSKRKEKLQSAIRTMAENMPSSFPSHFQSCNRRQRMYSYSRDSQFFFCH